MQGPAAGHLAMLLFSALVAGSFPLGALAAPHLDPAALNALRLWLASALLLGVALGTGGIPRSAARAPWRHLILGALYAIYFVTMFEGLKTAPPVGAAAVFTLTPLMSAGFGWLLLRQRLTGRMAAAIAIGAAGALWVIFRGDLSALMAWQIGRGEAIYFWGCVAHAVYTPLLRLLNRGEGAVVFTFGTITAAALVLTLWGWRAILAADWAGLPAIVWITIVYTGIVASAITTLLLRFASLRLPAAKVMAYTYLVPAWVILWQGAFGGGLPPAIVAVGVALTCGALLLLLRDEEEPGRARPR